MIDKVSLVAFILVCVGLFSLCVWLHKVGLVDCRFWRIFQTRKDLLAATSAVQNASLDVRGEKVKKSEDIRD